MATKSARDQFVEDFLLVAENDQKTYNELMTIVEQAYESGNDYGLPEQLETWWSWKVEEMTNAMAGVNKLTLGLFVGQFLNNWGVDTWQIIARHLYDKELIPFI